MDLKKIRIKINKVIKQANSRNPFKIAQSKNLILKEHALPEDVFGIFFRPNRRRGGVIWFQTGLPSYITRYIISHEIGHALLGHTGTSFTMQSDYRSFSWYKSLLQEKEAHLFAACLLLDGHECSDDMTLSRLANETGVPYNIIEKWHTLNREKTTPRKQKW